MVGPDIAFNKPAYSSSVHNDNTGSFGPEYVNNRQAVCNKNEGPIAHTKGEADPWFKVDLRGTFYIKTVAVLPRKSKFLFQNLIIDRLIISKEALETSMSIRVNVTTVTSHTPYSLWFS